MDRDRQRPSRSFRGARAFYATADGDGGRRPNAGSQSAARLAAAIAALPPERGRYCLTNRIVGTISVYQAGEWAIAHTIRHNQQAKRILGA